MTTQDEQEIDQETRRAAAARQHGYRTARAANVLIGGGVTRPAGSSYARRITDALDAGATVRLGVDWDSSDIERRFQQEWAGTPYADPEWWARRRVRTDALEKAAAPSVRPPGPDRRPLGGKDAPPKPADPAWTGFEPWLAAKLASRKFLVTIALVLFNAAAALSGKSWHDLVANPANLVGFCYIVAQAIVDASHPPNLPRGLRDE